MRFHSSFRIPDNISDAEAAPILCAGVTSYKALKMANASSGDRVVILGAAGGLGHLAIQYAKAMGYEVVAVDFFDAAKEGTVRKFGADFLVNLGSSGTIGEKINALQPHRPISACIVFAPSLDAVSDAVEYASPGATIVTVALPPGKFPIPVVPFILKELKLQGSIVGTPRDLAEAFRYAAEGKVKAHVAEKPFNCVNEVLKDLEGGKITGRVVLRM